MTRTFRFRPRYRGLALASIGVGGALGIVAGALGFLALPLATGVIGVAMGGGYLLSPAWKLAVTTDASGLRVASPRGEKFALAWADVTQVVASASTKTCFVDGGEPAKSLLVPGDGAPAPYDIADRAALYDEVLAHVPAAKVVACETLEAWRKDQGKKSA